MFWQLWAVLFRKLLPCGYASNSDTHTRTFEHLGSSRISAYGLPNVALKSHVIYQSSFLLNWKAELLPFASKKSCLLQEALPSIWFQAPGDGLTSLDERSQARVAGCHPNSPVLPEEWKVHFKVNRSWKAVELLSAKSRFNWTAFYPVISSAYFLGASLCD